MPAAMRLFVVAARASTPAARRSSTWSLKPPALPMPCTGGGGTTMMNASWIAEAAACTFARIARLFCSGCPSRSSKDLSGRNIVSVLERFVLSRAERPLISTV